MMWRMAQPFVIGLGVMGVTIFLIVCATRLSGCIMEPPGIFFTVVLGALFGASSAWACIGYLLENLDRG